MLVAAGFSIGAFGSAWRARESYAEPWAKMRVEHEGVAGKPMHTRVVFENPKLAVQAVDLSSTAEGVASSARVALREGEELVMTYDEKGRPATLTSPDGASAHFAYESDKTRVTLYAPDGSEIGSKRLTMPALLTASATAGEPRDGRLAEAATRAWSSIVGTAFAAEADDEPITVTREVSVALDVRMTGADADKPGAAQIEASCAPYACVPAKHDLDVPGASDVAITVSSSVKKSALAAPGDGQIDAFKTEAKAERKAAGKDLPKVGRAIGAVALTAMACKSFSLASPLCVKEFRSNAAVAGGALTALGRFEIKSDASVIDPRASELFLEDEARAELDKETKIEVCVSRDGYARVCATVDGRPFGATPMEKASRSLELRRGVGGTLVGSFVVTQQDGADCKFSPSPKTAGPLRLTFDDEHDTVTASLTAAERGSRANLGCSLGTANMSWSQNYTISATQTFTKEQLGGGGKLPLHLTGTMTGSGGYNFSNCRTGDGTSANCPGGKSDGYSYPVTLDGTIDLDTHVGSGNIVVSSAPLPTGGTWRVPAEAKP